jgi:hypothetical protein
MQPAISYHLAQAHVADLRHRAQRHTLARAARQVRRNQPGLAPSRLGTWGRRAKAGLIARIAQGSRRRRDSREARTQRPIPTRLKENRRRPLGVDPGGLPNSDSRLLDSQLTNRGRSCPQP